MTFILPEDEFAVRRRSAKMAWETWCDYFAKHPPYRRHEPGPRWAAYEDAMATIRRYGDRRDETQELMCGYAFTEQNPYTGYWRMAP